MQTFHARAAAVLVLSLGLTTGVASPAQATAASSSFNSPGQHRTRDCVPVKVPGALIPLRYSDFTPTGFYADPNDPGATCPVGTIEIDAHEILQTPSGRLYFHPGGGGYHNIDRGTYGHVWIADLASSPDIVPPAGNNGDPCSSSVKMYTVDVKSIPDTMYYKPNALQFPTGSRWLHYGNPPADQTTNPPGASYTYLVWSWLTDGNGDINSGGGMVRTLLRPGQIFHRCDVTSIHSPSYGPTQTVNGNVIGIYGRTRIYPDGPWTYGWLVHSHTLNGGPLVMHLA